MRISSKIKGREKALLFFLILIFFGINYPILDKLTRSLFEDYELGIVERVIDGDTVVVNGSDVRLLGINSPEKGERYYGEAKEYLENLTLHKLVKLKKGKQDTDLYQRKLRYVFSEGENINEKLVKNGFANIYFPSGKDSFYKEFRKAWDSCVINQKNICEKSKDMCSLCVEIKNFDLNNQSITLQNKCPYLCDLNGWIIKDEGRKNFVFPSYTLDKEVKIVVGEGKDSKEILFWRGEEYVWTKTGDSIFIRDEKENLVLWWSY